MTAGHGNGDKGNGRLSERTTVRLSLIIVIIGAMVALGADRLAVGDRLARLETIAQDLNDVKKSVYRIEGFFQSRKE